MIGTYITWVHTNRLSKTRLNRCGRSFGPYRALIDISEAVHEALGHSLSAYSNRELEKELGFRPPVRYVTRKIGKENINEETAWRIGVSSVCEGEEFFMERKALYA